MSFRKPLPTLPKKRSPQKQPLFSWVPLPRLPAYHLFCFKLLFFLFTIFFLLSALPGEEWCPFSVIITRIV